MSDNEMTTTEEVPPHPSSGIRIAMAGLTVALVALIVGVVAVGLTLASTGREGRRNSWDDATRAHVDCETRADNRTDTIVLEHARYDREATGIDDDESTVDLIEANVLSLIAFAQLDPDTEIVRNSVANIAARRERLDVRRAELADARADFDEKRPPLDRNLCPPAPAGARP